MSFCLAFIAGNPEARASTATPDADFVRPLANKMLAYVVNSYAGKQRASAANEPNKIMENERVASLDEIISSIVCARFG